MQIKNWLSAKSIRFVLITVVLGAVGSGFWEWILKPFVMGASEFGLNVATLGVKSFKDSLYKDIALGLHEEPSLRLHSLFFAFIPAAIIGLISGFIAGGKAAISRAAGGEASKLDRFMALSTKPMLVLLHLVIAFSLVQTNQINYINRAITHFNQLVAIAGPHTSEQDRLGFRSEFAQITSGEEYEKLVTRLEKICRTKNLKTPTFAIW